MQRLNFWVPIVIFTIVLIPVLVYTVMALTGGRKKYDRVEQDGGTRILGKFLMEVSHFMMTPVGNFFAAAKITPNVITSFSVLLAALAAVFIASGYTGLGGGIASTASILDLVDGMVARKKNLISLFGKLFDSFCDRVSELFVLAGLVILFRENLLMLGFTLALLAGSFLGSCLSALEREQKIESGRGFMRRPERVAYLLVSILVTQYFTSANFPEISRRPGTLVLAVMVILLGFATNISVFMRLRRIYLLLCSSKNIFPK